MSVWCVCSGDVVAGEGQGSGRGAGWTAGSQGERIEVI